MIKEEETQEVEVFQEQPLAEKSSSGNESPVERPLAEKSSSGNDEFRDDIKYILNFEERIKEIVYKTYDNIFDFDIKDASNGGDELKVIVTLRTRLNQSIPIRILIILNKKTGEYSIKRIYFTKYEKLAGLRDKGSPEEFVSTFMVKNWGDSDIDKFIEDNKDIIEDQGINLDKEDVIALLSITKERKRI